MSHTFDKIYYISLKLKLDSYGNMSDWLFEAGQKIYFKELSFIQVALFLCNILFWTNG